MQPCGIVLRITWDDKWNVLWIVPSINTLSWSWRSFLYSSSVYYWHLFLISSASVRSIPFLSFIEPIREGNSTPLQYSCLENPMDGGPWWAAVHGVAKSQMWLSDFTFTFHFHALEKEMATHSCSCLENPRDGGAWWAVIYGVAQSWTRLKWLSSSIEPIFAWNVPLVSLMFFEELSVLFHSIVFLYFFALIAEEGFLISPCYSLELCIHMLISFLFSLAFHFSSFHSYL